MKKALQILVVDDEAMVRQSIKLLLEYDGHEVFLFDNGEAALEQLAQRTFDLVITDFLMPGMPGDELVTNIRKLSPAQPIIMVTAFVNEYKMYGQKSQRANALLLKPFSLQKLRAAIEQALFPAQPDQSPDVQPLEVPLRKPDSITPPEP